jgi:nucleotide-binding universal stress UspA family protein
MFEKVLLPLDGSKLAETTLPYGTEFALRLGSKITLLSVSPSPEAHQYHEHLVYINKLKETVGHDLQMYPERSEAGEVEIESRLLVGHPAEKIVDYADDEEMALIVMATHGQSGIRRWAIGSVADKVIRATRRPVVLVSARESHSHRYKRSILHKVLVPLDGSVEGEAVFPHVKELGSRLGLEIILLKVNEEGTRLNEASSVGYLEKVADVLGKAGVRTRSEVRAGSAAEEIVKLAKGVRADIIAMSTHGRSGVGRWVFGSVANKVLQAGEFPVLLVRADRHS